MALMRQYLDTVTVSPLVLASPHSGITTTVPSNPRTDLSRLEVWDDYVSPEVALSDRLDVRCLRPPLDPREPDVEDSYQVTEEAEVQGESQAWILNRVSYIARALEFPAQIRGIAGNPNVVGDPDRVCIHSKGKPIFVIEYKTWWAVPLLNLIAEYRKCDVKTKRSVQQIYGYMTFNYCQYGVLTNQGQDCSGVWWQRQVFGKCFTRHGDPGRDPEV